MMDYVFAYKQLGRVLKRLYILLGIWLKLNKNERDDNGKRPSSINTGISHNLYYGKSGCVL